MSGAVRQSPAHAGKPAHRLRDVSQHYHDNAAAAGQQEPRCGHPIRLSAKFGACRASCSSIKSTMLPTDQSSRLTPALFLTGGDAHDARGVADHAGRSFLASWSLGHGAKMAPLRTRRNVGQGSVTFRLRHCPQTVARHLSRQSAMPRAFLWLYLAGGRPMFTLRVGTVGPTVPISTRNP
jgi:hypothetical protein